MKLFIFILFLVLSIAFYRSRNFRDCNTLNNDSAGLYPKEYKGEVVQVYAARTYGAKGTFAVHSWVAYKKSNESLYSIAEVIGWMIYQKKEVIRIKKDHTDRYWYGNKPFLIEEIRGQKASMAIKKIEQLIKDYSYKNTYVLWPGPNSNSFISYIIRNTSELKNELPAHAIGKDWLYQGSFFAAPSSGLGFQFSIFGLLGFIIDFKNGIEINLLTLTFGIDFLKPALKLPLVGRIGIPQRCE